MWWSILPSTSEFQLKMIYYCECDLVVHTIVVLINLVANFLTIIRCLVQNNMFKKLKLSNQHTEGLKGNMTSTRILPPARPYYCLINSE